MSDKIKKCPLCSAFFNSIYSLHLHCVENHHKGFVCCPICYEPFKNSLSNDDLVMHSNLFHERRAKQFIGINTEDFTPYTPYQFNAHMINGMKCMACSKILYDRHNAERHYRTVHLTIKYLCHRCPRRLTELRSLKTHYRNEHGPKSTNDCVAVLQDFAGFEVIEKMEADTTMKERDELSQPQVINTKKARAKSSFGAGIRILGDHHDFLPSSCGLTLKLTFRNENGCMKLLASVMNDASEFIEIN